MLEQRLVAAMLTNTALCIADTGIVFVGETLLLFQLLKNVSSQTFSHKSSHHTFEYIDGQKQRLPCDCG